jgi:hypothetical protein
MDRGAHRMSAHRAAGNRADERPVHGLAGRTLPREHAVSPRRFGVATGAGWRDRARVATGRIVPVD